MGVKAGAISTANGSAPVSGLGGRPRCILFLGSNQSTYETGMQPSCAGGFFGWAVEEVVGGLPIIHNYCEFAILSGGRCSNLSQNCARAQHSPGSVTDNSLRLYEGAVTEITDDGFTVTFTATSASHQIHYLAIWDIEPGYVFPWEFACDLNLAVDVGFAPAVFFALGQWRNSCHEFPKTTNSSLWGGMSWGDVAAVTTSCWSAMAQSVFVGLWSASTWGPPSGTAPIAGVADPWILGSICTGVASVGRTGATEVTLSLAGCGGGYDWIWAQFSECFLGDCLGNAVGDGAIDSETAVSYPRVGPPEAVVFNNFQDDNVGTLFANKQWGAGFATPDYQCGFSIREEGGAFYQSATNSWISKTDGTNFSAGQVDFTPAFGDISLVVKSNSAGGGEIGHMGIKTVCPQEIGPLLVSYSGFNTHRPSGTQITTRGGHITPGEGGPGRTVP